MKEEYFLGFKFWNIYFPRPVHRRWLSPFWLCSENIDLFTCNLKCDTYLTFPFCSGFCFKLKHNSFPFFLKFLVLELTMNLPLQILGSVSIWFAPVSWTLVMIFFWGGGTVKYITGYLTTRPLWATGFFQISNGSLPKLI